MTVTLDHAPLRQAVDADPADGALRLVYADWLEEHGDDVEALVQRGVAGVLAHPGGWEARARALLSRRAPGFIVREFHLFAHEGGASGDRIVVYGARGSLPWEWGPLRGWRCGRPRACPPAVRGAVLAAVEQALRVGRRAAPA